MKILGFDISGTKCAVVTALWDGGGLAQLGYLKALEKAQSGEYPMYFQKGMTAAEVTAKTVAAAAVAAALL